MAAARPSGRADRSWSIRAASATVTSPETSNVSTTGSSSSRPRPSSMARRAEDASRPVFSERSRAIRCGSSSWQTSMPPPMRRSHHHSARTPVKFSRTRSVALSASSSLSFSATAPLYQLGTACRGAAPGGALLYNPGRREGGIGMLQVKDSMAREVTTLSPEDTAGDALALCRERRIRHLPVLEDGSLVGIVSDRDLRSGTPAFGDPARAAALSEVRVGDVMAREVVTTDPDDPIDEAANTMRERRINCLPVLEGGDLVGIVTSSDVMESLVYLLGAHEPGSRMEVVVPDRPGTLAGVAGLIGELGINIVSVVTGPQQEGSPPTRVAVFRVDTIDPSHAAGILEKAGYAVLWPPKA